MKKLASIIAFLTVFTCIKANNDLTLHYDQPATFFEEALVIGNGRLGGIVYGGTKQDRISLNDITLWTGEPDNVTVTPDAHTYVPLVREAMERGDYKLADDYAKHIQGHLSEMYQPLGNLFIDYEGEAEIADYRRTLSLCDAIAITDYLRYNSRMHTEYFVSAPDSVIVVYMRSEDKQGINATLRLTNEQRHTIVAKGNEITTSGYAAYAANSFYINGKHGEHLFYDENRGIHFSTVLKAINKGGKVIADGEALKLNGCREVTIIIANATSFNGADKDPVREGKDYMSEVKRIIDKAQKKTISQLRNAHIIDYRQYFDRVSLNIGTTSKEVSQLPTDKQLHRYTALNEYNPDLEELYFQYGRYLLISCSRTPGVPPNLQGLWNEYVSPPWHSNYTININLEENYWAAETTNLSEMHAPLFDFVKAMARTGQRSAQDFYGVQQGWCSGNNSDIWAMTNPTGEGNSYTMWGNWTMGGAWLCTHIWEHYMFTQDKEFLERYYPTLKEAADFCVNWLIERDGELITSPGTSPENEYVTDTGFKGSVLYGATSDLALIRECVGDAVMAARILGKDDAFIGDAEQKLARLRPYHIGKHGQLLEWYHDWDDADWHHRHQSHLIGLYPGHHISPAKTPELAKAAARSLEIKGDMTTGWSTGWRINLLARLLDGEGAYHMVRTLLKYISPDSYRGDDAVRGGGTYPNLLDAHSPFQIDGNFGGCAGIAEMLLQSTDNDIYLLPACPVKWGSGSVKGLCARGGYVIDMEWEEGEVKTFTITSRTGGTPTVHVGDKAYRMSMSKCQCVSLHI